MDSTGACCELWRVAVVLNEGEVVIVVANVVPLLLLPLTAEWLPFCRKCNRSPIDEETSSCSLFCRVSEIVNTADGRRSLVDEQRDLKKNFIRFL